MGLANCLQSVDTPSIPLSDLHHLSERTTPNNFKKFKGIDGEGWTLRQRIKSHSFFSHSNDAHDGWSIGDAHLDLAGAANDVIPLVNDRLTNKWLVHEKAVTTDS
jgi:hypothetical protein